MVVTVCFVKTTHLAESTEPGVSAGKETRDMERTQSSNRCSSCSSVRAGVSDCKVQCLLHRIFETRFKCWYCFVIQDLRDNIQMLFCYTGSLRQYSNVGLVLLYRIFETIFKCWSCFVIQDLWDTIQILMLFCYTGSLRQYSNADVVFVIQDLWDNTDMSYCIDVLLLEMSFQPGCFRR